MTITYLTGPAGTGKTTYAVERLRHWLEGDIPAGDILVIVPQQTLIGPYRDLLRDPAMPGGGKVDVVTISGLALQLIDLFWPLVAEKAGFGRPQERPVFLTIETAQYYLQQAIEPLLNQGYFDPNVVPVTLSLPRLMSQILDNLNKAAQMGLPHTDVSERLAASLALEPGGRVALEHVQACADRFREFCLARNLLDYSLRIETFQRHLWPVSGVRRYLTGTYRYLIIDNIEEDTPLSHAILREWLPETETALIINDEDAGYRTFLGANWRTASALQELADETIRTTDSYVSSPEMQVFGQRMAQILQRQTPKQYQATDLQFPDLPDTSPQPAFIFEQKRFYPQSIDWVIDHIAQRLDEGTSPNEIVVMAPFVSDALRFSFMNRMEQRGLPARSHRPSRPLSEEPAAKTLFTLARLAFPKWQLLPPPSDVAQALHQAIDDLDLIRASLLTQVVYRQYEREQGVLTTFDQIEGKIRERISYQAGVHFDRLLEWLMAVQTEATTPVLDHLFNRLFGELLSQPGFGFHGKQEAGEVVANLIDSARKFRRVAEQVPNDVDDGTVRYPSVDELNRAYIHMIEQGIMAAQYIRRWDAAPEEAVLITPATTFLMSNRPVDYQIWLDAGSSGWWERISQPLTHPYILAADWEKGRPWIDADEVGTQYDRLYRLILGLTRRCRNQVVIVNAEIGEQGYEQRGQLLVTLQQMLRQLQRETERGGR
ncbi:MAG: hypothetical protein AAF485_06175 [Chloroflexota bacterium]